MSTQKARPIDAVQLITTSFKQFESKLDKLQRDVNYHGRTLSDLRTMVTNLSGGTILASANANAYTTKGLENKSVPTKSISKTTANQYEVKVKKKHSVEPLPLKKVNSYQMPNSKVSPETSPFQVHRTNKMELGPKGINQKHLQRHRRADAQRKTMNTIKAQKLAEKKRVRAK